MTLDELKKKIAFSRHPGPYEIQTRCRATIEITVEIGIDKDPGRQPPRIEVERRLTEEILHRLYDDRQRECAELLMQHALAFPMSAEFHDSTRKLIKLARHMMPSEGKPSLHAVAEKLYKSAHWSTLNLAGPEQAKLWEDLRDALGLPKGTATKLGV